MGVKDYVMAGIIATAMGSLAVGAYNGYKAINIRKEPHMQIYINQQESAENLEQLISSENNSTLSKDYNSFLQDFKKSTTMHIKELESIPEVKEGNEKLIRHDYWSDVGLFGFLAIMVGGMFYEHRMKRV